MVLRGNVRPGGRSARVQTAIHQAVRELLSEMDRAELTVPMIAAKAGVTPSTIYRRWGNLQELLADVAVERFQPDSPPPDTGNARTDLEIWTEQYAEEMASEPGRAMIRDVLASATAENPGRCCQITLGQLETIAKRAADRGEDFPAPDLVLDQVVAPIMYRLLFNRETPADYRTQLVDRLFERD